MEVNWRGEHSLTRQNGPSDDERASLKGRALELEHSLGSAGGEAVRPHVAALMLSLRQAGESAEDRAILQDLYAIDLADLPLFAIEAACSDFRKGAAGDGKWLPTQAQVREVAMRYVKPWADELRQVNAVLSAEIVPDDDVADEARARVADRAKRLVKDLAELADPFKAKQRRPMSEMTMADAQAKLDAADPSKPVPPLSDEAMAIFMRETLR